MISIAIFRLMCGRLEYSPISKASQNEDAGTRVPATSFWLATHRLLEGDHDLFACVWSSIGDHKFPL